MAILAGSSQNNSSSSISMNGFGGSADAALNKSDFTNPTASDMNNSATRGGGAGKSKNTQSAPGGANMNKMILSNLTVPGANASIVFYGILPDSIQDTHNARFESIQIAGRSSNMHAYSGGDSRSTSLSFMVHEDYLAEFNGGNADIRDFVAQLKALTYPVYRGTATIAPRCELKIGSFFRIKGVCTQCSITWKRPIRDGRYIVADVSMSFEESLKQAVSMTDVIGLNDLMMV